MKVMVKRFIYVILAAVMCVVTAICGQGKLSASADTEDSVQAVYESTNVLNNLKGATIGGKEFDLADYPHNDNGKPQIISFVEFCYSYYAEKQDDFGLYVYIYNPQDVVFDMSGERNKIQLTYGNVKSYSKYVLEFLNYSTEAGYEGRFWKFKIRLTDEQKSAILREVDENSRVYKVSGVELAIKGNSTEYTCAQVYTYKGYALGYGSELAQSDTLICTVDGFDKYLSLDVRSTYYRPEGSNGSEYKQDTLHSVYFSVPNSIIDEYGEMTAVHATWLNAHTAPIYITGDEGYYDRFCEVVGKETTGDYGFHTNQSGGYLGGFYFVGYSHGYNYSNNVDTVLNRLDYAFYADNGDADSYSLPAEALVGDKESGKKGWFETYTARFGGSRVNNKYSAVLFDEVDSEFTDIEITASDSFKLTSVITSQNLWQKLWGTSTSYTNTYNISAIQKVTKSDLDNALNEREFCKNYFVAESDYEEISNYIKTATAKNETVYLFRYYQSEYFAVELSQGVWKTGWHFETVGDMNRPTYGTYFSSENTNAYLMQMWVQLDFDIIDLTFTKDGVDTIIPVIMSPMDIAADATPPLETMKDGPNWLAIILGVILLIIIVILLFKFMPGVLTAICKGIIWIISLPFRLLGALFKAIGDSYKKHKAKKQAKVETGDKPKDEKRQKEKREKKNQSEETDIQKKLDSGERLSRDEIESYLDSIDWNEISGS